MSHFNSEDLIFLHILQKSERDTEPTWENIFVTPFKYFLYQRKIFPVILKLFQYPQAENISIVFVFIYAGLYDLAVECFVMEPRINMAGASCIRL